MDKVNDIKKMFPCCVEVFKGADLKNPVAMKQMKIERKKERKKKERKKLRPLGHVDILLSSLMECSTQSRTESKMAAPTGLR